MSDAHFQLRFHAVVSLWGIATITSYSVPTCAVSWKVVFVAVPLLTKRLKGAACKKKIFILVTVSFRNAYNNTSSSITLPKSLRAGILVHIFVVKTFLVVL